MDRFQSTLRKSATLSGVGLHSGRKVSLEILPAMPGTGIVFRRTDLPFAPIKACVENISSTDLSTTIGKGENKVATIEHLMAAFAGLGIDNALVLVDAPELPIMDGSAAPFVDQLLLAGIVKVNGLRDVLVVKKAFEIRYGDKHMRVEPADRLRFSCTVDYGKSVIGRQTLDLVFTRSSFLDLCESRTFCHLNEVNAMRSAGLALGGSLDNAIVVTDSVVMNPGGLRSADEFVRHKLLDAIGDLALLGAPLIGRVTLNKGGHALHAAFVRELMARKDEHLSVVEFGSVRDRRSAMSDEVANVAAAAAIG